MHAYTPRSPLVAALLYSSRVLSASARRMRMLAHALSNWLEHRRAARVALKELSAMSDRELHDVGLSRAEIEWVARQPLQPRNAFRPQ